MIDSFINYRSKDDDGQTKFNKGVPAQRNVTFFEKIVIEKGCDWKNNFDNIMLFASVYNSFT
jgi:hypothetical protein